MSVTHLDSGSITGNGSTNAVDIETNTRDTEGYRSVFVSSATWSTSSIAVEISPDGTNWFPVATLTANGVTSFIHMASFIRLTMSTYGGTAVNYWIK